MAEHRPFPPSPRRLALAHQAGVSPASAVVVGALAWCAALIAVVSLGAAIATRLGNAIIAACNGADGVARTDGLAPRDSVTAAFALALPIVAAAAIAATFAHLAQTRTLWFPRRKIPDAPHPDPARMRRAVLELANAAVVGAVTLGWLFSAGPRFVALASLEPRALLPAVAALLVSLAVAIALAWIALGVIDALVRRFDHTRALAMTHAEKREDARRSSADPRWRSRRAALTREPRARTADRSTSDVVAAATVVILGDDLAIAITWDPMRQPIPTRTAIGRAAQATQLLGLARRHRIAVHRDPALATALAAAKGPVPEARWPRLAEIVAALGPRGF